MMKIEKVSLELYREIKAKYQDRLLLFRDGDIYAAYGDDAESVSKIARSISRGDDDRVEFPCYMLDSYLPQFIRKGYKVGIWEAVKN